MCYSEVETREFQASQYPAHTAPLIEGSVIWTPTARTTLTGTLTRDIEDPQSAGTNGYVLTQAHLVLDYELLFNVFVRGRVGIQYAEYLQNAAGSETNVTVGGGVSWLISRNVRLSLDYDFTKQSGSGNQTCAAPSTSSSTIPFSQSQALLSIHFAL